MIGETPVRSPERIIHVATAGFAPTKGFMNNFPLSPEANSFTAHKYGQLSNDFYGLFMNNELLPQGTRINILNPGSVSTDIHKKGELPKLLKFFYPLIGRIIIGKRKTPQEYAKIPYAILMNQNADANQFTLIDAKGKGIKGGKYVTDIATQESLYTFAKERIDGVLKEYRVKHWL